MPTITIDATKFVVDNPDFDSRKRYIREASGGTVGVSAGRTWDIGSGVINTSQPWLPFRFNMGSLATAIAFQTTVVSGNSQTSTQPAAITPAVASCKI